MSRSIVSRADLVNSLRQGQQSLLDATAAMLHLTEVEIADDPPRDKDTSSSDAEDSGSLQKPDLQGDYGWTQFKPAPPRYWQLVHYEKVEIEAQKEAPPVSRQPGDDPWRNKPTSVPVTAPLATKRELLTRLRKATGYRRTGHQPDLAALVRQISECRLLNHIPRKPVRVWGSSLHVIQDRAKRLTPYWSDQDFVCRILQAIYPRYSLTISRVRGTERTPEILWPPERRGRWVIPPQTTTLLVLGDLGTLATDPDELEVSVSNWVDLGQQSDKVGNQRLVLAPCRTDRAPQQLTQLWSMIPWEERRTAPDDKTLQQLLTLVSPTIRLEPGLLREIRRQVLDNGNGCPELESQLWQHKAISSRHSVAASFDPVLLKEFRSKFAQEPPEVRQQVMSIIREWRGQLSHAIWFEELIGTGELTQAMFADDVEDAILQMQRYSQQACNGSVGDWPTFLTWARGLLKRLPATTWQHHQLSDAVHQLHEKVRSPDDPHVSDGYQPARRQTNLDQQLTQLSIYQQGTTFVVAKKFRHGSPVGTIRTRNGSLKFSNTAPAAQRKTESVGPGWADQWGHDDIGDWATLRIGDAVQKLRWIPAGNFQMGSPDTDDEAWDDEKPQHKVTITTGYWMFDTPCTQQFWQAIMGSKPSKFKGDQRPVEKVSWDDCQKFVGELNQQAPGLQLRLPTEAEWEYTCRAGSSHSRYGELDEVAWYSSNGDGKTHDVAQKAENDFGMYDMVGNVWEWCLDHSRRPFTAQAVVDPLNETDNSRASRVVRGGCWVSDAQGVRAAYRDAGHPGSRSVNLGFRCLSSSPPVRQVREAAVSGSELSIGGAARPRSERPPRGENFETPVEHSWKPDNKPIVVERFSTDSLTIESDIDRIAFQACEVPSWANESGNDKFGLWVHLKVKDAQQRLRWIPPGVFQMGSSESDRGAGNRERPQHPVTISTGFWMFDTPCTQSFWHAVTGNTPSQFSGDQRPVEQVSWDDCLDFCVGLNNQFDSLNLRLPTEAEWEYACRAGSDAPRYGKLDDIAWHGLNSQNGTHDVMQKAANQWGLFDMLGNVWEWCHDEWCREYSVDGVVDPLHEASTTEEKRADRVVRGGCWVDGALLVRAAYRVADHPEVRNDYLGFRCLSSSVPASPAMRR